jgi:hypothetical protein
MLIHEVADHLGRAERPMGPLDLLARSDQACLRLETGDVIRIVRPHQPIDKGAGADQLGIAIDHDQCRVHHAVSASILS